MKKISFIKAGKSDCDSLPLGNGDIGINVWAEKKNKISMYISKTDSFSSALELLKIGKVNIQLNSKKQLILKKYSLNINKGICEINYNHTNVIIFVDYNNPCIRINIESKVDISVDINNEIWRNTKRYVDGNYKNKTIDYGRTAGQDNINEKIVTYPDKQVSTYDDCVLWYHQNPDSHYEANLKHQELLKYKHLYDDPLKYRTFGACIMHDNKKSSSKNHNICIGVLTEVVKSNKRFINNLHELTKNIYKLNYEKAFIKHKKSWINLNKQSYIKITSSKKGKKVSQGYNLQRYLNICSGRGEFPIKFNGSIFTFQIPNQGQIYDPDYRMWGGCYWFQNTRLIYWSILNSGDFNLIKPFFNMYENAYNIVKAKTKDYYGFEGLLYPETMTPWGTYRNVDYGFERENIKKGEATNVYIKYYYSGMLELITLMIEYYNYTKDEEFKENILLKHAKGVLNFFYNQYNTLDDNGKIIIYPSQALENWQDATNPTDVVAGLTYVLNELVKLNIKNEKLKQIFIDYKSKVPDIPMYLSGGSSNTLIPRMVKPAKRFDKLGNLENPELYAVFPYRVFSFEKANIKVGRETFKRRGIKNNFGWTQDGIQAATLAMPQASKEFVEAKFLKWNELAKFPAFYGPNFDWVPDQDHGNSASIALQRMLIQNVGKKIYLFPAWPKKWDVKFKMYAYNNTIVEGEYKNGKIIKLITKPKNRIKDIEICFDKHLDKW